MSVSAPPVDELLARASRAAAARWAGATVDDLQPLPGGISSLTYAARLTGAGPRPRRVVLKAAPPGLAPVRNRDVLRQARIQQTLSRVAHVRVPEVIATDPGDPPERPPLFLMAYVDGDAYEPRKDAALSPPAPGTVTARAFAAARMLAQLHAPEPRTLGLGEEPVVGPAQELERWAALYATAGDDLRAGETELQRRLRARIPAAEPARVLHGDYRLGNMQFQGAELAAIIDWEIWALGDPRADLAWLMAWCDPVQHFHPRRDAANRAAGDGMPDPDALLAAYRAVRAIETTDLPWFSACCYYKIAATTAVLQKRNRRRREPDQALATAMSTVPAVLERGHEILNAVAA